MNQIRTFMTATIAIAGLSACKGDAADARSAAVLNPDSVAMSRPAPDSFDVAFETGKGTFTVKAYRAWAPRGVDRFHYLVTNGYYDGVKFFRNIEDFMVQFGIHGDPDVNRVWEDRNFPDDSVRQSNLPGLVTFATGGPNTRTVQLFINKRDNSRLDAMGFAPIGRVTSGMEVVMSLFSGYGEGAPRGGGPEQGRLNREGNRYLNTYFPQLDSIISARVRP